MTPHHSLYELNKLIKDTLSNQLDPTYWVVAEISELRVHHNGHCYLELVEKKDDKVLAKMRATIWSYTYRNLSTWFQGITGQPLKSGLKVLCNVNVQFHELYGLSLNVKDIDANYTLGEKARKRQEIIDRLVSEGVFDLNHELELPIVPQRIAIISSSTAAGYGDFMDQLESNPYNYRFQTQLFQTIVQGDGAPQSIVDSLIRIHNKLEEFDLVVLIRGGGSQIDLDCFDDYEVADHIAQFPLPVVTGIGHERDESIADLVANTKLKTPTAVAEFLVSGMMAFDEKLDTYFSQLSAGLSNELQQVDIQLDRYLSRINTAFRSRLAAAQFNLTGFQNELKNKTAGRIQQDKTRLNQFEKEIQLLNPEQILKRGYSFTSVNGKPVNADNIKTGDSITTSMLNLKIESEIKKIAKK